MKKARFFRWQCSKCGEREWLMVSSEGEIIRPTEGMEIYISGPGPLKEGLRTSPQKETVSKDEGEELEVWAPDFAFESKAKMAVLGISLPKEFPLEGLGLQEYSRLYLLKIQNFLEGWRGEPLPVIFDRIFTAPYIGAGEVSEVLIQMWQELEEIRRAERQKCSTGKRARRTGP
ncbi:MAG: hypothetical protein ACK4WB_08145, partial [Desulfatiglandales bacterium]